MRFLDSLYMIVNTVQPGVVYAAPAKTMKEAWENATAIGTGLTRKYLVDSGWKCRKVSIFEEGA